jgi:hypothetical protein
MTARVRKTTPAAAKPDFMALLDATKLPERTVPICMRADLVAEHELADRQLLELLKGDSQKFNDGRGSLREKLLGLEAEMRAATYDFRLRGLPGPRFRSFVAEHPSRVGDDGALNQQDNVFGFNTETGFEPLIRLCLVDPDLDDAAWARLMGALTDKQFEGLAAVSWYLNRGEVDVPFSRAASRLMDSSEPE